MKIQSQNQKFLIKKNENQKINEHKQPEKLNKRSFEKTKFDSPDITKAENTDIFDENQDMLDSK